MVFWVKFNKFIELDKIDSFLYSLEALFLIIYVQATEVVNVIKNGQFLIDGNLLRNQADLLLYVVRLCCHSFAENINFTLLIA